MFKPLMAHENNIKSGRHYNEMSFNIEFIADTVTKFTKIILIINNWSDGRHMDIIFF